jgi:hypothetical protein
MIRGSQMMSHLSQETRERLRERLFGVMSIAAIAGIALGASGLFGALMDTGFRPGRTAAVQAVVLCGWGLIAWISYRVKRQKEFPATWAVLLVVALGWAALLINRMG